MSEGHSTALRRSLGECLKEWMTLPSGTFGLNHLLMAAEAELALVLVVLLYRGKAKGEPPLALLKALGSPERRADQRYLPLASLRLQSPPRVLFKVDVGGVIFEDDTVDQKTSSFTQPHGCVGYEGDKSHLASSFSPLQSCYMRLMFSTDISLRLLLSSRSGR